MSLGNVFGQLTKIEKVILSFTIIIFIIFNFFLLSISAQKLAIDDQILELEIKTQKLENSNKELELKISELTTYDRIISQANAAGMGPNQQNIRTVEEN
ncbi:MAG: hypothetical protein ACRC1D_09925 [Culicoidibacterales bacterium]